jgi:hypothetical protein
VYFAKFFAARSRFGRGVHRFEAMAGAMTDKTRRTCKPDELLLVNHLLPLIQVT